MDYSMMVTVDTAYDDTVAATREALADNGFGVLTEIDVRATLKAKLDVDVPPQIILGACRPPLAHRAMQADPSIATLLPCNVVVREVAEGCIVEAIDPTAMMSFAGESEALADVAEDASARIRAALDSLTKAREAS
ncbi:MAG: ABC transporter [Actinobacteria bacterium 69-20]|jgi:uncharacterized protein (DUF302 family)|nr:DUF302 domain-containing protein [Actinomycetota bacterium]OJV29647.1 MAG: ABC transporter [Actinobacteria bacterium 69-20]